MPLAQAREIDQAREVGESAIVQGGAKASGWGGQGWVSLQLALHSGRLELTLPGCLSQ